MLNTPDSPRSLLCLSISATDGAALLQTLAPVRHLVDVVEVRLDGMHDSCPEAWMARIPLPVLATNRPRWEGGAFTGSEQERIALLCRAIRAGACYVDLELASEASQRAKLLAVAKACKTQVILSHHDFCATPDTPLLEDILARMIAISGIYAGKIVTMASTATDTLRLLGLQQLALAARFPLSSFAMGEAGRISRLSGLYLGAFMTYVCPDKKNATAPGQLTVQELLALQKILADNPCPQK